MDEIVTTYFNGLCVTNYNFSLMTHSLLISSHHFPRHRCHKQLSADLENSFKDEDFADVTVSFVQCSGSVTVWYGIRIR